MDSPCIKQTVCKVLKIFQYGKYLVAYVLKRCRSLPARHCGAKVQAFEGVSEPTSRTLYGWGAGCLNSVRTYFPGFVGQ